MNSARTLVVIFISFLSLVPIFSQACPTRCETDLDCNKGICREYPNFGSTTPFTGVKLCAFEECNATSSCPVAQEECGYYTSGVCSDFRRCIDDNNCKSGEFCTSNSTLEAPQFGRCLPSCVLDYQPRFSRAEICSYMIINCDKKLNFVRNSKIHSRTCCSFNSSKLIEEGFNPLIVKEIFDDYPFSFSDCKCSGLSFGCKAFLYYLKRVHNISC